MIVAKNTLNSSEISKVYEYKDLYEYYTKIPEYDGVEADIDNVIKAIHKKVLVGIFSAHGRIEIRLKKIKSGKRESSVVYEATPMNFVKEESKFSNKTPDSPKEEKGEEEVLISLATRKRQERQGFHNRHSSKSTKKMSIASYGYNTQKFASKSFVQAKGSLIAFNKKEQRKQRKELKQLMQNNQSQEIFKECVEDEVVFEEIETKYEEFKIQDYPNKALESVNDSRVSQNREDLRDDRYRKSQFRMPPTGRSRKSRKSASKKLRKISSTSLSPSNIGSFTTNNLDFSISKFKINVIEPVEIKNLRESDTKQTRTFEQKDLKAITNKGNEESALDVINRIKKLQRDRRIREMFAATKLQRIVKGYLARKDYRWKKACQNNKKKIYQNILVKEGNYHLIQGYLDHAQDIKIIIFDLKKRVFAQELNISKREYVLVMDESMGMNTVMPTHLDSSRSATAFKNVNIDQVDFNYLIDKHI